MQIVIPKASEDLILLEIMKGIEMSRLFLAFFLIFLLYHPGACSCMDLPTSYIKGEENTAYKRLADLNSDFSTKKVDEFKQNTIVLIRKLNEHPEQKYGRITTGVLADRLNEFVEAVDLLSTLEEAIKSVSVGQNQKQIVLEICEQLEIIASRGGVLHTLIYSVLRQMGKSNIDSVKAMVSL